jgi:GNAT superfamily N-acetyltransferase
VAKEIRIRKAEPKDIVNIAKLLTKGWNEQVVEYAPIDDVCGYRWILGILEEGFVAVADLNGRIVGAACASPFRPPWSLTWLMDMEFLYVLPSFRGGGVADGLRGAVEGFADKHGASLTFTIQTGEKPFVKDRMIMMSGWTYAGGNFLRPSDGRKQEDNDEVVRES